MDIQRVQSPAAWVNAAGAAQQRTATPDQAVPQRPADVSTPAQTRGQSVLSSEEQEFFAKLFPASEQEGQCQRTYTPAGLRFPPTSGTFIDRKG